MYRTESLVQYFRRLAFLNFILRRTSHSGIKVQSKHESADQLNPSTCLFPYRNELVPPLHDTCGTFGKEAE